MSGAPLHIGYRHKSADVPAPGLGPPPSHPPVYPPAPPPDVPAPVITRKAAICCGAFSAAVFLCQYLLPRDYWLTPVAAGLLCLPMGLLAGKRIRRVLWLAGLGVVTGVGEGRFNPDGTLTREQAATMLSRLAAAMGSPLTAQAPTFADSAAISTWALDAVGQMQGSGIMGGVGDNAFDPQGSYSREQSMLTMLRLYESMK